MGEIGSEFWKPGKQHIGNEEKIYLCGRTALDIIVRDAMKTYGISCALLPSYCCHTMIEPFLLNNVTIRFYDVYVNGDDGLTADIPAPRKNEMLYLMKYFGDTDIKYEGDGKLLSGWAASVEDLTHSCFAAGYTSQADYWFTSYRKWFAVEGIAAAGKRDGKLPEALRGRNDAYYKLRSTAFSLKQRFMDGGNVEKQNFLDMFGQAEKLIEKDYRDFGAGYEEVYALFLFMDKVEDVRQKRRNNARILMDGLSTIKNIKRFANFQNDNKCPLFVPVIIEGEMRDSLRKYLIDKNIYCPVHWPLSELHKGISGRAAKIYCEELSLVCDQRYDANDMEKIINQIHEFLKLKWIE